jgi:2-dehydropantoate 2-reductase
VRYVVYGAGAVGGTIGARLHEHGHSVVLIARGAHYEALRDGGMRFETPDGVQQLEIPVVDHPSAIEWTGDEVVLLTMKSNDTVAALDTLVATAPADIAIACVQNGVANEAEALRRFAHVYGVCPMLPAAHLEPGVVLAYGEPNSGILDLGRYPSGVDAVAEETAAAFDGSRLASRADPRIMRVKYRKLLLNLGNALEAASGHGVRRTDLYPRAVEEAEACYRAAGIDCASETEDRARRDGTMRHGSIAGRERSGGSTWQSLARGAGVSEIDWLNGEIVLLGRRHGVPTPVNAALQRIANRLAREHVPPGSLSVDELEAEVAQLTGQT